MNIKEAIDSSIKEGKSITRDKWVKERIYIIPTNTPVGMILCQYGKAECRGGWQPNAEDLQADDWR